MQNSLRSILLCSLMLAILAGCAKNVTPVVTPRQIPQQTGYVDAVELKLKFRELADQMLATVPNDALKGYVAMPASFVNENDTNTSSPLGRLIAESMYYEFNQRGFPTREYRLTGNIAVTGGKNDLALASSRFVSTKGRKWVAALLVGTYCVDRDAIFVNARLVRASDGLVLRTGQLVLPNTPVVMRMAGNGGQPSLSTRKGQGGTWDPSSGINAPGASNSITLVQGK